jgi:hypothetical protein
MKPFAPLLLVLALQAQSPPPARSPWQPRPVIVVDPRPYLASPSPRPKHRPTPRPKRAAKPHPRATTETFERLDTSPSPAP